MGDLGEAVADRDEPRAGKLLHHVAVGELRERHAPAHRRVRPLVGQAQERLAGELALGLGQTTVGLLGEPRDGAVDSTGRTVGLESEDVAAAQLPQLEQGRREERQRAGLALDVGDECIDEPSFRDEARLCCRSLDRAAQLVRRHRADEHLTLD